MPVPLYLDECVNRRLADRLDSRGISATTAVDEGALGLDDESQVLFAARLHRMILSHNQKHFLRLHAQFTNAGRAHAGILLIPNGPLPLLGLRTSMLVTWLEDRDDVRQTLARWQTFNYCSHRDCGWPLSARETSVKHS
jgi:hypothetical protein